MCVAVHDQRAPLLREHLPLNQVRGIPVAHERPGHQILDAVNLVPIHWRIAKQDPKLATPRTRGIQRTDFTQESAIDRQVTRRPWRTDGVLPGHAKGDFGNLLAANEPIHHVLVARVSALDDDVVDRGSEPGVANERESKGVSLLVPVIAFTQRDEPMRSKCVKR